MGKLRDFVVWLIGTVPGHQKKLRATQKRHSDKLDAAQRAKATMFRENRKASEQACKTACLPRTERKAAEQPRAAGI